MLLDQDAQNRRGLFYAAYISQKVYLSIYPTTAKPKQISHHFSSLVEGLIVATNFRNDFNE